MEVKKTIAGSPLDFLCLIGICHPAKDGNVLRRIRVSVSVEFPKLTTAESTETHCNEENQRSRGLSSKTTHCANGGSGRVDRQADPEPPRLYLTSWQAVLMVISGPDVEATCKKYSTVLGFWPERRTNLMYSVLFTVSCGSGCAQRNASNVCSLGTRRFHGP